MLRALRVEEHDVAPPAFATAGPILRQKIARAVARTGGEKCPRQEPGFVSTPTQAGRYVRENGLQHMDVVSHAQLIRDRQQNRVRCGEGFIFPELFDEHVRFRRVAPPETARVVASRKPI